MLARNDAQPVQVAIKLDYDAVAVYEGGVPGFEATSPLVTGVPLSERPAAAQRYERHIASQEAAFVAALRAEVPSAQIGTQLRTVYGGISAVIPANAVETCLPSQARSPCRTATCASRSPTPAPSSSTHHPLYEDLGATRPTPARA